LRNIIFKENLKYALNKKNVENVEEINYLKSNKETIIKNINNTENIYGKEANKLLNSSYDLLKYFDLNEYIEKGFYNRLYVENLNFIQTSLPYIIRHPIEATIVYINFELLEDYPTQQKELLKYLDLKYNKKLSFTSKNIFTADFNKKLNNTISNYKTIIYYYIAISVCFIIILLHGLFVYFNRTLASIYFSLIIIALIVLYYYN